MQVTVAAWIGSANAGDALIFAALRRKLHARAAHVTALTINPDQVADNGVTPVGHTDVAGIIRAVRSSDALVFGGGGLLQDQTSPFNLPYHLSRLLLARAMRIPWAIVGVGAGPLRTAAARAQVRFALGGVGPISVRDRHSAEELATCRIGDVRIGADLVLSLPSPTVAPADRIVASLRPWTAKPGRLPVSRRAHRDITEDRMVAMLAAGLDDASRRLGLPVHLVALQPGWDDLLHARVADRMVSTVTTSAPAPESVLDEIAASRVVVAMRYHAAIAAVLARRPAVLIGYDPKMAGLTAEMGSSGRLLEWSEIELARLGVATARMADAPTDGVLDRLRARERVNDTVLDDLLGQAAGGVAGEHGADGASVERAGDGPPPAQGADRHAVSPQR